jgi:hypothetical protein
LIRDAVKGIGVLARLTSLHRVAVTRNIPGLFQERLSDIRNGRSEQLRLLLLGNTKNKVHEASTMRAATSAVSTVSVTLHLLLNDVVDFAVQAIFQRALVLHNLTFAHHVSFSPRLSSTLTNGDPRLQLAVSAGPQCRTTYAEMPRQTTRRMRALGETSGRR